MTMMGNTKQTNKNPEDLGCRTLGMARNLRTRTPKKTEWRIEAENRGNWLKVYLGSTQIFLPILPDDYSPKLPS